MADAFDKAVEREKEERRRKKARKVWAGLRVHLKVYLIVNAALFGIWALESLFDGRVHKLWPLWVVGCWGIGLLVHYLVIREAVKARSSGGHQPSAL